MKPDKNQTTPDENETKNDPERENSVLFAEMQAMPPSLIVMVTAAASSTGVRRGHAGSNQDGAEQ